MIQTGSAESGTQFVVQEASAFTREHILALAEGTTAAVRVPGFLDTATCVRALDATGRLPVGDIDVERVPTRVTRFGPSLHDYHTAQGVFRNDAYWRAAEAARNLWTAANLSPDPVQVALDRLGTGWGSAVAAATIGQRPLFAGMFRDMNVGTRIHFDEIIQEYPNGLFDQKLTAQLAFNLWVKVPETGGATTIWKRRWHRDDQRFRDGYGIADDIVQGFPSATFRPAAGDAALFNSAHMHAVEHSHGQRRVAYSFFLGLTDTDELITWA